MSEEPRIHVRSGVLATEQSLLAALRELLAASRADPARLALPVRVVVPSRSLRAHVSERIAQELGACAGLAVQTLHALALEVLGHCAEAPPSGELLFPVLARQQARRHPLLRAGLDPLEDGYGSVASTVSDLLDAGCEPHHAPALDERLAEIPGSGRARAVVAVSAEVAARLESLGVGHRSALLARAHDRLLADPVAALPARAVLVHGFADATGRATDFLEALLRRRAARVFIDRPPDPAGSAAPEAAARFSDRLLSRLQGVAKLETESAAGPEVPAPRVLRARGTQAEVRAVAERVAADLAAGVVPERIGIVARRLEPYASALRIQLARLGVPCSGAPGVLGPLTPAGRRLSAWIDVLERGPRVTSDRWLDVRSGEPASDLRLALHAAGAGRVRDVAALDLQDHSEGKDSQGREWLPLPVRRGLSAPQADDDESTGEPARGRRASRRRIHRDRLHEAIRAARVACAQLEAWPASAPLAAHRRCSEALLAGGFAGYARSRDARELRAGSAALEALPGDVVLTREEFVSLLRQALRSRGRESMGGAGGGVQILSVTEARARSFERLYLVGLNRDLFPRPVEEDWLLPDAWRAALTSLLPDLPVKERGYDEERYLFAQLLTAAPEVTLAYQAVDDAGRERPASPLLERLWQQAGVAAPEEVPSASDPRASGCERTAQEQALVAGLHASREQALALWPAALAEAGVTDAQAVAAARRAVLVEQDPREPLRAGAGPYLGWVGPAACGKDLRHNDLFVTTLESVARCPWQSFLRKLLRLEPVPDALEALPDLTPLLVGSTVHAALEAIARLQGDPGEPDLARAAAAAPHAVSWPEDAAVQGCVERAAREVLAEAGYSLVGFERVLARHVAPFLDQARVAAGGGCLVGAELQGRVDLGGGARPLFFRADRVDRIDGRLVLTDFKTGRAAAATGSKDETRVRQLRRKIEKGELLQAPAYAHAGGALSAGAATGRYWFLAPALPDAQRISGADADQAELLDAFEASVATLLHAWEEGVLPPRLARPGEDSEPPPCAHCELSEACVRGDSGARRRLHGLQERVALAPEAFSGLWWLGSEAKRSGTGGGS